MATLQILNGNIKTPDCSIAYSEEVYFADFED
jgi:hypothetical protein